ncbi:MAG TPA: permease-like cell division protein FtsX [Acidimicrobiales bacterium]|nr:permease-like cell division protein FtsX [Acidimicrobiales bacterium]
MAFRVDYFAQETIQNLRRNLSLTVASLLTVGVSLALVGAALLLRQGVDNATTRWQGGIEFIVFLQPDVSQDQADAVGRELRDNPEVKSIKFVDKQQAYDEFKVLFRNSPELVDTVTPDILPASWRVVPSNSDPNVIQSIGEQFKKKPGVMDVVFAKDTVESVMKVTRLMQIGIFGAAVVLLVAACLLIINTIRTAVLSRRQEIEVMKLVGASNWFIRVPFMLEGLIQGLIGAGLACVAVWFLNDLVESRVTEGQSLAILQNFSVSHTEVNGTILLLLFVGGLVGFIGSGVAVSSYLDV